MALLFKRRSPSEMAKSIFRATYQHSLNLGKFVALYKTLLCALRHLTQSNHHANAYIAGLIGGIIIWGKDNPINSQINMYILSRILWGLARLGKNHYAIPDSNIAFSAYAGIIWGFVMWLFFYRRSVLQPSLQGSMQYLYNDSEKWPMDAADPVDWLMRAV